MVIFDFGEKVDIRRKILWEYPQFRGQLLYNTTNKMEENAKKISQRTWWSLVDIAKSKWSQQTQGNGGLTAEQQNLKDWTKNKLQEKWILPWINQGTQTATTTTTLPWINQLQNLQESNKIQFWSNTKSNITLPWISEPKYPNTVMTAMTPDEIKEMDKQAKKNGTYREAWNDVIHDEMVKSEYIPLLKQWVIQTWNDVKKFAYRKWMEAVENFANHPYETFLWSSPVLKVLWTELDKKRLEDPNVKAQVDKGISTMWKLYYRYEDKINNNFEKRVDRNMNKIIAKEYQDSGWIFESIKKWDTNMIKYGLVQWFSTSVVPMIPWIIAWIVTKNPTVTASIAFASTAPIEDQEAYEEAIKEWATRDEAEVIWKYAWIINWALETAWEFLQLKGLLKPLKKNISKEITKKTTRQIIGRWLWEWSKWVWWESLTEWTQELVTNALIKTINENKDIFEWVLDSMIVWWVLWWGWSTLWAWGAMIEERENNKKIDLATDIEALNYVMESEKRKQQQDKIKQKILNRRWARSWEEVETRDTQIENTPEMDNGYTPTPEEAEQWKKEDEERRQYEQELEDEYNRESQIEQDMINDVLDEWDLNEDLWDPRYQKSDSPQSVSKDTVSEKSHAWNITITPENSSEINQNLNGIKRNVRSLNPETFLQRLKKSFTWSEGSNYIKVKINGKNYVMRISNHHTNANTSLRHPQRNTSIVIKLMKKWDDGKTIKFKKNNKVNLAEFVYDPANLDSDKMRGIIDGIQNWMQTGEYTDTNYDSKNESTRKKWDNKKSNKSETGEKHQLKYEDKNYTPWVANKNEKDISGKEWLKQKNKINDETIEELARKYWVKTEVIKWMIEILRKWKRDGYAYWKYKNQLLTLSEQIKESTAPHELLHAIFDMIDPETKVYLISQVMKSEGWNAETAEERLADSFSNFFRTGKIEWAPKSTWWRIKIFFKRVRSFINGMNKWRNELDDIFTNIITADGIVDLQSKIDESSRLNKSKEKMRKRFMEYRKNAIKMQKKAESENKYQKADSDQKDNEWRTLSNGQAEYFKDSKVRDDNGNLLKVYHGTNSEYTVYDSSLLWAGSWDLWFFWDGWYFATHKWEAWYYGRNIMEWYLNITNPFYYGNMTKIWNKDFGSNAYVTIRNLWKIDESINNMEMNGYKVSEIWDMVDDYLNNVKLEKLNDAKDPYNGWDITYWKVTEYGESEIKTAMKWLSENGMLDEQLNHYMMDKIWHLKPRDLIEEITDEARFDKTKKSFSQILQDKWYDGIVVWDNAYQADEIVAFRSNEFKNVDNLNPTDNEDIRYQRVYHWTKADFDKFDSSHMGQWEWWQAHGWWHYVAVDKKTGKRYADKQGGILFRWKKRWELPNNMKWTAMYTIMWDIMDGKDKAEAIKDESEYMLTNYLNTLDETYKNTYDYLQTVKPEDFEWNWYLYEVEIPDPVKADTPTWSNYLDEDYTLNDWEAKKMIKELKDWNYEAWKRLEKSYYEENGKSLYLKIENLLWSDKDASEFLNFIWYDGIHYDWRDDWECYVIFNDNALEIKNHGKYQKAWDTNSEAFKKRFDGSKVVNEDGSPKIMYHWTPNKWFTVFKEGYFTENKEYADKYQNPNASSIRFNKKADNPWTYAVYLSIKNPFDTRDPKAKKIFEKEYFGNYWMWTPLWEKGLPDWMDGNDLQEFIMENHPEYDGLILDEWGIWWYWEEVQDRWVSYVPFKPNQIKSATDNVGTYDPNNEDIRYQRTDSEGNSLSEWQIKYFENSKIRKDWKLLVVYHWTHWDFTIFDRKKIWSKTNNKWIFWEWFYFTSNKKYWDYYAQPQRSKEYQALEWKTKEDIEKMRWKTMKWYLNITNPFYWRSIKTSNAVKKLIETLWLKKNDLERNSTLNNQMRPITDEKKAIRFRNALEKAWYDWIIYEYDGTDKDGNKQDEIVAFYSNQFKNIDNKNPTDNEDIRYQKMEDDGISALQKIAKWAEYVKDAMSREDLKAYGGESGITFYWGNPWDQNKSYKWWYGISHIAEKHGAETLLKMISVLARWNIERYTKWNNTIAIWYNGYTAILSLSKDNNKETRLLTWWKDNRKKTDGSSEVSTQSTPTQNSPTFSRTDLGAVLSERSIIKNSENANENTEKYQKTEYEYDENWNRKWIKFWEDNEFDPSIFWTPTKEEQIEEDKENEKSNPFYNAWIKYNNQNYKDDQITIWEFMDAVGVWLEKKQEEFNEKQNDILEAENDPKMLELQLRAVKLMEEEWNVGKKFWKNVSKEVRDRQQAEVEKKREDLAKDIYEWMYPWLSFEESTYEDQSSAWDKEAEWEMLWKDKIEEKLKYFKKDKNGNWEKKDIKIETPQEQREKIERSWNFDEVIEPKDRVIQWETPEWQKGRLDKAKDPRQFKKVMEKINSWKSKTKVELKDVTNEVRALERYKENEKAEKERRKKEKQEEYAKKKQEEYKRNVRLKAFQRLVDMQRFEKFTFLTEDEIKQRWWFTDEEWKKITEQLDLWYPPKKRNEKAVSDFNKAVDSEVKFIIEWLTRQNNMKRKDAEKNSSEIWEIDLDVLLGKDEEKWQKEVEEFERIAEEEKKKSKKEKNKRLEQAREDVTQVEIDKERENSKSEKERVDKIIKSTKSDNTVWWSIKKTASDILTPVSTRIREISPKIYRELMRYFQNKDILTNQRLKEIDPFLKAMWKIRKENPVRFMDIWVALANRNIGYANGLLQEYWVKVPTKLLDTIFDEAEDVGLNINYLGSYYPLSVKAPKSFLEELMKVDNGDIASEIEKKIQQESQKKWWPLDESEITAIINSVIAWEEKWPDVNLGNKHLKKRNTEIERTPQMLEYCDDPISTLITYIEWMTDKIERAKFLWKSRSWNVHTLADYVYNAKNGLTAEQQDELMELLKSVFNDASPNKFYQTWRDIATLTTLGSPSSTLTQIGDLSFSIYENWWREALKAVWDIFMKRKAFDLKDMWVINRWEEYTNINSQKNLLQKAIHNVFKLTFFSNFDTFWKSTFIQSTWNKRRKRALKWENGDPQLIKDIMKITDDEYLTYKIINDLRNWVFSEEVALVMYMKLWNIQPLTKAQMPKAYLDNPNGRLFYQFKTFGIKQLDYVLQETKQQTKWFKNLSTTEKFLRVAQVASMIFIMTLMWAWASELKDITMRRRSNSILLRWLFGEEVWSDQIWDKIWDSALQLFWLSRYTVMQMKSDPVDAITSLFTTFPATNLVAYPFKDIVKAFKNDGSINWRNPSSYQLIPVIWKYRYWIYWGGQDKQQEALDKEKKTTTSGWSSRSSRTTRSTRNSRSRRNTR